MAESGRLRELGLLMCVMTCAYGCVSVPTCQPGTYSSATWPPRYWVQPLPESKETIAHVPPDAFVLVRSSEEVEAIRFFDVMAGPTEDDGIGTINSALRQFVLHTSPERICHEGL
jgi:hypothetical protein